MDGSVLEGLIAEVDRRLADVDAVSAARYPGDSGLRQPVHTAYVPANAFSPDTTRTWGAQAMALMDEFAPSADDLARAVSAPVGDVAGVLPRVRAKLATQPIEDLRVDFEDGFGPRTDAEEDDAAVAAGVGLAELASRRDAPLLAGVRVKGLQPATRRRGLRTLDLVIGAAARGGGLPPRFVVTWPKVMFPAEVTVMVEVSERLEAAHGLPAGAIRFELQIEVPQAVVGADGEATVARLVHAAGGRCEGLHYGTYDFSAAAGVAAGQQALDHPLADHAKAVMQLAAAGTGVRVSDGSTNVRPVGDREKVHAAWQLHHRLVLRSLRRGLYQGWDLHPGHLPTRYLATYAFLRHELAASAARLRAYTARAATSVLDEPATAQALAGAVLRGLDCGATDLAEVEAATGLDRAELGRLVRRTSPVGNTTFIE